MLIVLSSLAYLSIAIVSITITFEILTLPKDENGNKIWPPFVSNNAATTTQTPNLQSSKTTFKVADSDTKNVNFYDNQSSENEFERKGETLKTIIKLDGVAFKDNSLDLVDSSFARLRVAVVALNKFSKFSIVVAAHTDNTGDSVENKKMSKQQATIVKKYFINNGIKPSRLASIGFGGDQPIAKNTTEKGRLANSRVELRIY